MSSTPPQANRGVLRDLFDLSFTRFVTARVIRILYVLTLIMLVLAYVGIAIVIFSGGGTQVTLDGEVVESGGNTGLGVLWLLVLGPLFLLLYTLAYRVFFEVLIVIFRIYENTRDQLEVTRSSASPSPTAAPRSTGGLGG